VLGQRLRCERDPSGGRCTGERRVDPGASGAAGPAACSGRRPRACSARTGCCRLGSISCDGADEGAESNGEKGGEAVERRSELRCRYVLRRRDEEDLVTRRVEGVGLGLRWDFIDDLVARVAARDEPSLGPGTARHAIDFLEISPENYMGRGGRYPAALGWLAERIPVVTHGLTLSLGGMDPIDDGYVGDLRRTVTSLGSPWHSDHMCFGSAEGRSLHELLPVAFKRSNVSRIADRIRRARDLLGVPLAVENVSYYWHPGRADTGEAEFLSAVCDAADCGFMFDVNNAYVNATNFGFDVRAWLRAAPLDRAVQMHVAGHEWFGVDPRGLGAPAAAHAPGAMIVDTHGADVDDDVLALLDEALARTGPVPIVIERDQNVPDLDALFTEVERVRAIANRAASRARAQKDAPGAELAE
jgi:uncharacterized protein (UPF0276 family)